MPDELGEEDFIQFTNMGSDVVIGLIFRCPGCKQPINIGEKGWKVDSSTISATPSIVHDKDKGGCGWHGHLKNGELNPC